jgi:hypothetical protein
MTATVTLPNVPKASKKVTKPQQSPEVQDTTAEVAGTAECLTYGQAIKLIAGILRHNPNNGGAEVVECIRDVVAGTGLDVDWIPNATQEEETEEV